MHLKFTKFAYFKKPEKWSCSSQKYDKLILFYHKITCSLITKKVAMNFSETEYTVFFNPVVER